LLLSEKVRVEIFIPDLPDPSYRRLLTELETELSYTFGGCTLLSASGNFRSESGLIIPNNVSILFIDVALELEREIGCESGNMLTVSAMRSERLFPEKNRS